VKAGGLCCRMVGLSLVCHEEGAVPAEATAFRSDFVPSCACAGADADVIALSVQGLLCSRRVSYLEKVALYVVMM